MTTIEKAWEIALSKRKIFNDHWLYLGPLRHGYGVVTIDGIIFPTHRLSMIMNKGMSVNSESYVLHKCQYKNCFFPDHLYEGNQSDNLRDIVRDGNHHK